jgi:26S proteasome regulatory subunit N1
MTSVPKPLKFLRPHLKTLKETYAKLVEGDNRKLLADIISLLAMTDAPVENVMPESLKYRLVGSDEDIGTWGHEVGEGGQRTTTTCADPTLFSL